MALKKLRILIADDEPITRMNLREMLEQAGYPVVGEASDGLSSILSSGSRARIKAASGLPGMFATTLKQWYMP